MLINRTINVAMMRQLTGRRQETAEAIKMATTTEIAKSGGWSAERIILINLINTSHDGRNSLKPSAMAQVGEATTGADAAAQGAPHAPPPPRAQSAHPVSRSADFFVCPATGPGAHGRWHPRPGPPTAAAMPDELGKIRCVTGRSAPEANLERTYLCSERANCSGTVRCSCTFLWGSRRAAAATYPRSRRDTVFLNGPPQRFAFPIGDPSHSDHYSRRPFLNSLSLPSTDGKAHGRRSATTELFATSADRCQSDVDVAMATTTLPSPGADRLQTTGKKYCRRAKHYENNITCLRQFFTLCSICFGFKFCLQLLRPNSN
jgi:hypothetical protein